MSAALAPIPPASLQFRKDDAILAAAFEAVTSDWFFEYEDDDGKKSYQISARGAAEYARIRGELGYPIRFPFGTQLHEVRHNAEVGMEACVVARDARTGAEATGYAFRPHYTGVGTNRKRDEFNDRAAASEANRNATLKLIPLHHITALLKARTKIAKANHRRFELERKHAQAERLKAAPRIKTSTAADLAKDSRVDDPYGLEDAACQGTSPSGSNPSPQGSDS